MPRGGKRLGAGRPFGSRTKKTQAIINGAAALDLTPLDYMLLVMKDETASQQRRDAMAVAAAPYIHPRLSTINADVDANVSTTMSVNIVSAPSGSFLTNEQIEALAEGKGLLSAPQVDAEIFQLWKLDHSARDLSSEPEPKPIEPSPPIAEPAPLSFVPLPRRPGR